MTIYLKASGIIKLHDWLVKLSGGENKILHQGLVESAAARPLTIINSFDEKGNPLVIEIYPDILSKATSLAFALIKWHGFLDGNKRIGILAMAIMFEINGMSFHWPVYLTKYSIQCATEEIDEDGFKELIRPLITSNLIVHYWKVIRYEWLPRFAYRFLRDTHIAPKYLHRLLVDWYGAGHEEIAEKLRKEIVQIKGNIPGPNLEDDDFLER